eukprot:evm.model.NODE_15339_length_18062_cov_47.764866.1
MATAETTSDAGTTHTTNKASRKPSGIALAFAKPDVSPEEAEEYIKKHVMPDAMLREGHWRIKEAPKFHVNRSPIWTYGVMYDRPAVGSMTAQRRWFCLATETCRIGNVSILPGPGATGNCNIHLRSVHNIVSVRSKSMSAKKAQDQEQLRKGGMEKMKMIDEKGVDGGQRYDKLNFVKYVVIGCFQPFNFLESSWMRHHYKQLVPTYPVQGLHPKAIKHLMTEIYSAMKKSIVDELEGIKGRFLPSLAILIDIWEDKFSGKKFLGIRVRYLDDNWRVRSKLLSLRFFFPSSELREDHQLSVLVSMWVKSCLSDYGLKVDNFVGAVSDSGSDVKRCCTSENCLGLPWEWCGPHLLNRALVDGLGWTETSTATDSG